MIKRQNGPCSTRAALAIASVLSASAVYMPSSDAQPVKPVKPVTPAIPGELLVKFQGGLTSRAVQSAHAAVGASISRSFSFIGWQKVKLPKTLSVAAAAALYSKQPGVLATSPNYIVHANRLPNDTRYGALYGMTKISAPTVWDTTTGNPNVVVAVIDTGVDYNHEDLAANMWRNPGESGGGKETNGVDDDSNGYADDVFGIDAINDDTNPIDDDSHGTHCSGTIGGIGNNSKGVAGVNWNVKIMALKFLGSDGGTTEGAITCLQYVVAMKARGINIRVTNNSWGGGGYSQALKDAFDAAGNANILNAVAAGNEANDNDASPSYPASYNSPSIIAVAASGSSDEQADFSNYGATTVDLAAPGVDIVSSIPGTGAYDSFSGTSMAAPHVAGAAALLAGHYSTLGVADLKGLLMAGVDRLSQWQGAVVSGGRLNLARSFALASPTASPLITEALPQGTGQPLRPVISAAFSRSMNKASVQSAFRITPNVAGTFNWSNSDKTMRFTPSVSLTPDTLITVKILGSAADTTARTLDGNFNGTGQGTPTDDYTWSFRTTPPPPPNDPFSNAQVISGASGTVTGTNVNATLESGEPDHDDVGGGRSVWYRWTATSNDVASFDTGGSGFDTVLAVYTGTALSGLTEIASNDDNADLTSSVSFQVTAGQVYSIAVAGYGGDQGSLTLHWTTVTRPRNDDFANAQVISGAYGAVSANNSLATAQSGEPSHAGAPPSRSIWYKWTAPSAGRFIFTTAGSEFDTVLGIYTGSTLSGLSPVVANDDLTDLLASAAGFEATAGTVYHVAIDGYGGDGFERGPVQLTWYGNDNFANARTLTGSTGTISGFNYAATAQPDEPSHASNLGSSLWFRWTAPGTGRVVFTTVGSELDTVLAAYTGNALSNLNEVAANDDADGRESRIEFNATGGVSYLIALDGYSGEAGPFRLNWSSNIVPTEFVSIGDVTLTEGNSGTTNATFTVTLSKASAKTISVSAISYNGTARTPGDYTSVGARLIFAPGEISKTFSVPIKGDLLDEGSETFYVLLSSPVNVGISKGRGVGTIVDNDVTPRITIDNISIGEGHSGQRVAMVRLNLSAPSGQVVRVTAATSAGTATAGNDYVALSPTVVAFNVGSSVAYARVLINGDLLNEPNETFFVNLSSPLNATIADNQAVGTILNDDTAPSLTINDVSIAEGNSGTKNLAFTVALSKASAQTVSVRYASANGSAIQPGDYTAQSGTLSFAPGQTSKTINIVIKGDTVFEGNETLILLLSNATNASIGKARGVGTVNNDDSSG